MPLVRRGAESHAHQRGHVELIRRLAAHTTTSRSPRSSTIKDGAPAPGCRSPSRASRRPRQARHPRRAAADPDSELFTIEQAASELGVSHPRSTLAQRRACFPASRPPRTHPGGSGSPTRSAPGSCPSSRRLPPPRRGRQASRLRPPDRFAQGPTRRAARRPSHSGRRKGLRIQVTGAATGLFDQ